MKIILSFLALFITGTAICQNIPNSVEYNRIQIKNARNKTYKLGSKQQLLKAFGKAKTTKEPDEVLDGNAYTYTYHGFETYFNESNWESSQITKPAYALVLNGISFKVGDDISKFQKHFPKSYQYRERSKTGNSLNLSITHKKQYIDAGILVIYNDEGKITEIRIANNNS